MAPEMTHVLKTHTNPKAETKHTQGTTSFCDAAFSTAAAERNCSLQSSEAKDGLLYYM